MTKMVVVGGGGGGGHCFFCKENPISSSGPQNTPKSNGVCGCGGGKGEGEGGVILFCIEKSILSSSGPRHCKKRWCGGGVIGFCILSCSGPQGKGKVAHEPQVAHTARAKHIFCNMKQLGVLLLPPGLDASPSQVPICKRQCGVMFLV